MKQAGFDGNPLGIEAHTMVSDGQTGSSIESETEAGARSRARLSGSYVRVLTCELPYRDRGIEFGERRAKIIDIISMFFRRAPNHGQGKIRAN